MARIVNKSRMAAAVLLALTLLSLPTSEQNSMVDLNIMSSAYNMAYAVNELEQVDSLAAGGWLNEGQGNALRSKLDSVLRQLDMGNAGAACILLQAFSNQVGSLVYASVLTAEQGQPLIDSADAVSSELCL